jgi:hypothetical protein
MGLKSSYSRLVRLYKESRDRWRAKAIERRKANRLLELRIRDLDRLSGISGGTQI